MKKLTVDKAAISRDGVLAPFGHMATHPWFRWTVLAVFVLDFAASLFARH